MSTTVIVESVFGLPGLGQLTVAAALNRDYPVVFTSNLVAAVIVLLSSLLTDLVYTVVDPRVALERGAKASRCSAVCCYWLSADWRSWPRWQHPTHPTSRPFCSATARPVRST